MEVALNDYFFEFYKKVKKFEFKPELEYLWEKLEKIAQC